MPIRTPVMLPHKSIQTSVSFGVLPAEKNWESSSSAATPKQKSRGRENDLAANTVRRVSITDRPNNANSVKCASLRMKCS